MSRNKGKLGTGTLVLVALVAFVAAAGAAYFIIGALQSGRGPKGHARISRPANVTLTEQRQVTIYLPKKSESGLYLAPLRKTVEAKGSALDSAMKALLAAGEGKGEAAGLIPEGTKLLTPVKVAGSIATVNFSKELIENFSGGSEQEALTLNSIVHTLVDNSEGKVRRAMILVEGAPAESLGGHFELTEPIEADSTLLKPAD